MRHDAVHGVAEAGHAGPHQLLRDHRLVGEGAPAAAVLLRDVREQQPHRAGLAPNTGIYVLLLAPLLLVWCQLAGHELAHGVAEDL